MSDHSVGAKVSHNKGEPVRAIFVNRFFYPDESATSLMLTDLAFALEAEPYALHVVTSGSDYTGSEERPPSREKVNGTSIHRLPALQGGQASLVRRFANFIIFYLFSFVALLRLARRGDLVVCLTDPPFGQLLCLLAVRLKGARLVNWVQDIYPETAIRLGFGSSSNLLLGMLARLRDFCWKASAVNVAIGARMAEYIKHRTAGAAAIRIIPNWADEKALAPLAHEDNPLRSKWGYLSEDCVIGYSGNLGRAHDSETMLGAIAQLADDAASSTRFLFVGGGAQRRGLEERLKAYESVRFCDYQPRERLRESLAVPDIHWLSLAPQLEGLIVPSKFYGAAAVGRPIIFIGDEDGEIARLIAQGECGRSFAPGAVGALTQYLRDLSTDRNLRKLLGQKARLFAEDICARDSRLAEWTALLCDLAAPEMAGSLGEAKSAQKANDHLALESAAVMGPSRINGLANGQQYKGIKS
ncbi:MAG: colanic acid biosynthesis glycosyl transferase WcaI [Parasphingorhabdus sp.]|jgi:colanic acid biosynthesis glycosyl transferase WcaI|uniref:glycosyltransferase family 4 protein n=1 Tax=Parasphingorhabdus sp. TaxID=2709688 RepID=UPI002B26A112|nr:glycosyltransferase family 4 protein [Parasphingorhabdus sp.]